MTGIHSGRAFIRGNGKDNLRPDDVTIAEVLKAAGYATGLFGKWGLGHEGSSGVPTRQGFDEFYGYLDQHHAHNYYPEFLMRNEERVALRNEVPGAGDFGQGVASAKVEYSHDLIANEALSFVDRHKDAVFFLYLALTIPHANNEAGKEGMEVPELGEFAAREWPAPDKGFAAMLDRMDRDVGRLMDRLREHGIDERTIVLFTSDNGPHSEGGHDPDIFDSNGPLRGIKRDLYEGGIRVPLIARWPGVIAAGAVSDFAGGFQDFLPTLAEFAGASDRVPAGIDGLSFASALLQRGRQQMQHTHLYWAFYERGGAEAVRFGRWKAVVQPRHTPIELYDLESDIGERNDIADKHPDIVAEAERLLRASFTPSERWKFPPERKPGATRRS
jgi:arylsulfatase A-like enzyme